jgi:hypothetical protein
MRCTAYWYRWTSDPETADNETAISSRHDLIGYMESIGNTRDQIDHWLRYSAEMSALEGETPESVIETEAILKRMQGRIR